jgi:hypothetical protein
VGLEVGVLKISANLLSGKAFGLSLTESCIFIHKKTTNNTMDKKAASKILFS